MEQRENFYILLELSFDPPVNDPAEIKAAIAAKRQQWTRLQDTPGRRTVALSYLEMIPEIESVMADASRRQNECEQAKKMQRETLGRYEAELRVLESKDYITPREFTNIQVKYKPFGITKELAESYIKVPVSEEPPEQRADETGEILDRIAAKSIRRNLQVVGNTDLYDFLGEAPYSSIKKLTDASEAKRREAAQSTAKNARTAAAQELAGMCLGLFENFDTKQKYDRYLKISAYPDLADLIDEESNRSGFISPDVLLRLCNYGMETSEGTVLAFEQFIRRYCAAYDIPVTNTGRQISCPACSAKASRSDTVCASCAAPLAGSCPACGTGFEAGAGICTICGFSLSQMVKALSYIDEAENALIDSNWSSAQRGIQYARKYWPGHQKLQALDRRAKHLEERYASYVENIADCIKYRQYYAALELIQEAQARRIRLPSATTSHVEKVVADIEKRVEKLKKTPDDITFESIYALVGMVADSIELDRLLASYPPEAPPRLLAHAQGKQVRLSWEKSPSSGMMQYVVVRKQSEPPLSAFDGEVLYEGASNSYVDKNLRPLTECFYSVYARRGSTYSETGTPAQHTVLLVPEVENLRLLPTNGGAQLSWDFSPDIREVMIWRKLGGDAPTAPGDGVQLECDRLDGFIDTKLRNDTEYWYFVIAVYAVNGRKIGSKGICESVMPHAIVAPIEHLAIIRIDNSEDEYVANWEEIQQSDVLLLASPEPVPMRSGQMLPVDELLTGYRRIDIDARGRNTARFHYILNGGVYIFPVVVAGRFGTVGASQYVTNVHDVNEIAAHMDGPDICLSFSWPAGELAGVAVAWRFDDYPKTLGEAGGTAFYCTRQQCELDGGVRISDCEPGTYFFRVFAVFIGPDGEKVYSRGREIHIDSRPQQEILYEFKYAKPLFSSAYSVTLNVRSEEEFTLPRAVVVGKIGRLPLKRTDGMPLFELDKETKVRGGVSYEYKTSLLPQNLYIRLFLYDDKLYERFRLLPASDMKLT